MPRVANHHQLVLYTWCHDRCHCTFYACVGIAIVFTLATLGWQCKAKTIVRPMQAGRPAAYFQNSLKRRHPWIASAQINIILAVWTSESCRGIHQVTVTACLELWMYTTPGPGAISIYICMPGCTGAFHCLHGTCIHVPIDELDEVPDDISVFHSYIWGLPVWFLPAGACSALPINLAGQTQASKSIRDSSQICPCMMHG